MKIYKRPAKIHLNIIQELSLPLFCPPYLPYCPKSFSQHLRWRAHLIENSDREEPFILSQRGLADNCQILAVRSDICKIGQLSDRTTVSADNCQIGQLSDQTTVRSDNCQIGQLSDRTTVSGTTVSGPWTTVRKNCQCSEKTVRSYSCPLPNCQWKLSNNCGYIQFCFCLWALTGPKVGYIQLWKMFCAESIFEK